MTSDTFWAVSDLHLHPARPGGLRRFERFLHTAKDHTPRLVILGDLFDYWIGPTAFHREEFGEVFNMLREVINEGLQVEFVGGNRDFLARLDLSRELTMPSFRTTWSFQQQGCSWIGLHGDTLCHRDTSYQGYRRLFQTDFVGSMVRALPKGLKRMLIRDLRETSKQKLESFPHERHTLSRYRLRARLRSEADQLICGHLHDPGTVTMEVDGERKTVWILGDWIDQGGVYLIAEPGRPELERFSG